MLDIFIEIFKTTTRTGAQNVYTIDFPRSFKLVKKNNILMVAVNYLLSIYG